MSFDRSRLPTWQEYADAQGLALQGRGRWLTTRCDLHGSSDSLRVNTDSGGWCCMSCGAKGGDVLAHLMQTTGADFVQAARALGAWADDGRQTREKPRQFSASDALSVLSKDLHLCVLVISDVRRGVTPTEGDWQAFLGAAGRCIAVAQESRR